MPDEKKELRAKAARPVDNAEKNRMPAGRPVRKPVPVKASKEPVNAKPQRPQKPQEPVKPEKSENSGEAEKKTPKISKFTRVLLIWLVAITVVIAGGLIWFNSFLGKYEELYQESLPYHVAENTMQLFANQDADGIWNIVKDKIALSEFESEATVKTYVRNLVSGKEFTYKQTENYAEDAPEYYILADGKYIVAKLKLVEDETQKPPYGFKAWKTGELEFYTSADHKFKIALPEGYNLTINGKEVTVNYKSEDSIEAEENKYLKPYAQLPSKSVYEITGLYCEPVVKITDPDGKEVKPEQDKKTGEYVINIRSECPDRKEVEKLAISFTKDFANYISQDAGNYALDKYFPRNSKTLRDIKRNSSREWYTRHGKVDLKNEQVKDFICYTKDIVYVEAYVEQHMEMFWGSKEREVVKTTAHLYLCKIDGKWKIAGIRY